MRRACFVFGMLAMTVGCGSSGPPDEPEAIGAATGALTGDEPDLVISSASAPPSVLPGGYFTTWVTVCNQGNSASYSTQVEVSLSDDDIITPSDPITGYAPLGYLDAGQCVELGVQTAAAVPDGAYTLGVVVDSFEQVIELSETNNTAVAGEIGVGYGPDLIVSAVSGPPSALPGGGFEVQATVCNQGTTPSQSALVDVLLSPDAAIEPSDHLLGGGVQVPWLDPGQCESVTVPVSASVPEGVYHLGAIAHESGWYAELLTSNNARAGGLLGVGNQPDLVVSAVSGPPSQVPGAWFDASVTVCNQGTQSSYGTEVDLLLSPDGEITPADFPIGAGDVPSLSPGQCFSATIPANTYVPDGAYTLGAIVNVPNWTAELIETNNAAAGGAIGVGYQPDLIVSSVSGPPSAMSGGSLDASVTVCNQGTQTSYGSNVELYLSSDAIITANDVPIGGDAVPYLDPGQCTTRTLHAGAYAPDGAYHLGAIVDRYGGVPELIESNNAAAGAVVGVGYRPDLIVSSVSGPPSALPGSGFSATVTVCNQGTTTSYSAALELRLSPDDNITWADPPAGGAQAPSLEPGQCAAVTFPASAYVPDGVYHLGAIVDLYNSQEELNEANNAASGGQLGVGHRPDLIVSAVSGPPTLVPGSGFSASVTVCNQGTTQSYGSDVAVVLSSDQEITPFDAPAGGGYVPGLSPGQCASVAVPANAYVPDGAYHLGAVVDPGGSLLELIETNNAAAGSLIGVGHGPDLIVSAVSGPPSVFPGGGFDASVTVCNQGTQTSYGTHVELRVSADATVTAADSLAGGGPLPYLDPGQCATVTFPASAHVPEGAYHLGAIVDPQGGVPELIETNNAGSGALIGIGYGPDFTVASVSGPPSVLPGSGFDAEITVCNQGTTPGSSMVELRLSADVTITEADAFAGGVPTPHLDPGQCAAVMVPASAYLADGAYHLGGIVDPYGGQPELIETNNATPGDLIGVGHWPDLVVSAVSGPSSVTPGSSFNAAVTVCNQGTTQSYGADVELLLSSDDAITPSDIHAGNGYVPGLNPGQCASVVVPASAYVPDGAHHLGAIVDPHGAIGELIETNNAAAGSVIGVGYAPDLVVSAVSVPPSTIPGGSFDASVTVCNQGTQTSYGTQVELLLSADATLAMADSPAGNGPVPYLDPGQCTTVTFPASAYVPDGAYHLGAIVDRDNWVPELIETNNAEVSAVIGVGNWPDLVVSAISGPPSAMPGSGFDASVIVCNQGTQPSYGTGVDLYLSADAAITEDDTPAGGGAVPFLAPGQCTSVLVFASAYVPEGAYHLGAIVDVHDWQEELIESNNASAGDLIGVGFQPDLVVSAVSGPPSAPPGSGFDASVTVCNQGTSPSYGVDLELFLSSDDAISPADLHAGSGYVPGLSPGQCTSVLVAASAYGPDGAYHLGAIVDPEQWLVELIESNNAVAGSVIGVGFGPDFIVSAVSGPPSLAPGDSFNAEVTVCNQGTQAGHGGDMELRLSSDATITTADFLAGNGPAPYLAPGQCATVTFPASASYVPWGAYHLGAIVDPYGWTPELIETNNAAAGSVLGVGHGPDLIVSAVEGPPSAVPGSSFDAEVTVCNQGTLPSYGSEVELRLAAGDQEADTGFFAGSAPVAYLDRGQCTVVAIPTSLAWPDGAYRLGAVVDPYGWMQELIETNNTNASGVFGVGSRPDLIASVVSGPSIAAPGTGFDAVVTVCNQGTTPSGGTSVDVLLSSDRDVTPSDIHVGNEVVSGLSPGQCESVTVAAGAYAPDGAYHLGAIVDLNGPVQELIETNNTAAGDLIAIGHGPDLIVSAVSGPPSVTQGSAFNASVTVCNQGTEPSSGTELNLLLSPDGGITPADFPIGGGYVPYLNAGQCFSATILASAYVPDGAYHLGAIVDPYGAIAELIEPNNAAAGSVIGIGYRPDLIVSSVNGPPSLNPGGSFDASVTVCNQGTQPSYGTQVDLLLSADATLTLADSPAGNGPVPYLDPGQCATVTFPATAYVPDGAYHLGAIVDRFDWIPELIETNNAEVSAMIGIGNWPDLIVSAVSGPPSAMPGSGFDASVTVCNQGTQPSYGTDVALYLSADATITAGDTPAGGGAVPFLAPGQCAAVPVAAVLYAPDGTYHLGAIVDMNDWQEELIEANNAASGDLIGVGFGPDLVVSAVGGPPSAPPGSGFDASVTVCNQGTSPSYGADVELFLSSDDVIAPSDLQAGSGYVAGLSPGQCTSVLIFASAYGPDGAYRLGAIVDPGESIAELIETNNAAAGSVLGVGFAPDFIVSAVSGPLSLAPGDSFNAEVTVCNQGTQAGYGGDVELRLPSDATITTADFLAAYGPVPYLAPGQCATVTFTASAYVPEGAYHLGAVVDPYGWVPELIETNNATAGSVLGVGYRPDLIVSAVEGPPSALPGSSFDAEVTVCNQGTQPSHGSDVELRLAASDQTASAGVIAGGAPVPILDAGQCTVVTIPAYSAVPDGAYRLAAVVDPFSSTQELIETNNTNTSGVFGVGYRPDLIASVSGPSTAAPGSGFDATVTVCNQGTTPSGGTNVDVFLSSDGTITPSDIHVGNGWVPGLSPGQCESITVAAGAYAPDGAYHLGAIVDLNGPVQELIETNNAAAGELMAIGHGPDLVVSAVSGPPSVTQGGLFDVSITVCNQGTAPSYGTIVEVRLSADATITTDDFIPGGAWVPSLAVGQCESLLVPADTYVPVDTYTLGAIVDAYGEVPELLEGNNATAGSQLVVSF
ncbi:CARDB domain-containing protein [Sorangium sp. So ce327]|uniref:CARDB domain-containing protein n=1 Tax=Sorangium sp. So ce327 TaxID=3133301 RepID=UPI003F5DEFD8